MDVFLVGRLPFGGGSRRPQQIARCLAARGHRVLYLDPPHPFGAQVDPSRFAPDDTAAAAPVRELGLPGLPVASPGEGLWIAPPGTPAVKPGRWGWDSRSGWKAWAAHTTRLLETAFGAARADAPADAPVADRAGRTRDFRPAVLLTDHPAIIPALRAALPVPIVLDGVEDFAALAPSRALASAYEDALAQGIPQLDGLIAINRYLLESWERRLPPNAATAVIEQGVDLALFRPADPEHRRAARAVLGLSDSARVAGYLGRFDARVSFEDLERMLAIDPRLVLLVLGDVGSEGEAILQRLPGERVKTTGAIRQPEAAALLPAADFLLIPFRREPELESVRGLKLYEYLATGLPVVASFRRGMKAFRELLYLYTTWEEMEAALQQAAAEPPASELRGRRTAAAQAAGWERRAAEFEAFLAQVAGTS
jgi:glycosyltransferase involved in cell wall biosynthesis